jgi:PAS domain S-box-containing protein
MKLRIKVVLIVLVIFATLFFGISKVLTRIEEDNFQKLENKSINENVGRVKAAVEGRVEDLAVQLTNWSQWDDTYVFSQDGNQQFIDDNFIVDTFTQTKINFIVLKNQAGDIIYKQYFTKDGEEIPFPKGLEKAFIDLKVPAIPEGEMQAKISGIIKTDDGPFVMALASTMSFIRPELPANGYIAFGYAIDDNFSSALSKSTYLSMDFSTYEKSPNETNFTEALQNLTIKNESYIEKNPKQDFIDGFVLISDIFQNPAIIFRAHIPRDIHMAGADNIKRLNILLISIEVLQILMILILLEIFVLRKIVRLVKGVQLIGSKDDDMSRLDVFGKDEFSQLSSEINKMLDSLSDIRQEKKESETRFMNIADMAPVMIWISDFQNRIIYVNNALMGFVGKSEMELFSGAWLNIIHPDDAEKIIEAYRVAVESKQPLSLKYRVMTVQNVYRWIHVQAVTRMSKHGIFKGYTGTAVDITEFEESDLKRQEYVQEIDRMNALMLESELKMNELKSKLKKVE